MMKRIRIVSIVGLILVIITSIIVMSVISNKYSSDKGIIEGTGFVNKEIFGVGGDRFDVDDYGNIYFAVFTLEHGIVIYNSLGDYMYTLPIVSSGAIRVKIDEQNNILVYDVRKDLVTRYSHLGIQMGIIEDIDSVSDDDFYWSSNQYERNRNNILYVSNNGTILKEVNGIKSTVFTIPIWQKRFGSFRLVMILSIVVLFILIAIPHWIKTSKERSKKKNLIS